MKYLNIFIYGVEGDGLCRPLSLERLWSQSGPRMIERLTDEIIIDSLWGCMYTLEVLKEGVDKDSQVFNSVDLNRLQA